MVKTTSKFSRWLESDYSRQYLERESSHLKQALGQVAGPRVMQLGNVIDTELIADVDFPQLLLANIDNDSYEGNRPILCFDPAFVPIQADALSTIIVPHVLERHTMPHQVLREAHRILMPEGHIVLTGFSPLSVLGLQRFFYPKAVCPGRYITVKRVSDWLQLLGFEIIGSATFQYSPLVNSRRLQKCVNFLNPLGGRWLPMLGGGYIITARKKMFGSTEVGKLPFSRVASSKNNRRKLVAVASNSNKITDK